MTKAFTQTSIFSRLLLIQQALDILADKILIAEFVRRELAEVPGVGDIVICLDGHMTPIDARFQMICTECKRLQNVPTALVLPATDEKLNVRYFPVQTTSHLFGVLILMVANEETLSPYLDFISHIANAISNALDIRLYQSKLTDASAELRETKSRLEIRFAERTQELEYLATHDKLTGLASRALLIDRLQQAIAYGQRYGRLVAVAYLDIDNFKYVNDSLGTILGDELLKETARRLRSTVRSNDTVARIGYGEFVLVLADQENVASASESLVRVLVAVREPLSLGGKEITVTSSIGCSFYPDDGGDYETLLQRAGLAMHHPKNVGHDAISFFTLGLDSGVMERVELEMNLRQAVSNNELLLHYQPQVDMRIGKLVGFEALMRWQHPVKGFITPSQFIPIAEDSTLIVTMGEWALREASRQAMLWPQTKRTSVAVNLSARQFQNESVIKCIQDVLRDSGLDPALLELEITESSIMRDIDQAIAIMSKFKSIGVVLSIDDFGTGYSNLNYLRRFPVDILKIDQSFVRDIETTESAAAVARSIVAIGHSLHLKVIAEGVETMGQAKFLYENGCDEIQGYLIARPQPADKLQEWIARPLAMPWVSV